MMVQWRHAAAGFAALMAILGAGGGPAAAGDADPMPGCALVAEAASGKVLFRQGECDRRVTPASTFKIAIALMGFDAGILTGPDEPRWDYREGDVVNSDCDKGTVDPTRWEACSVVWYSQRITTRLGMERFQAYVRAFDYGNQDVSGNPGRNDGLTQAWLASSLQISADEEIAFLRRFLAGGLPVPPEAHARTAAILPVFQAAGGWTVHGKTGGGRLLKADGFADPDKPLGWFVGWADKGERRVVFVHLRIADGSGRPANGAAARAALLAELDGMVGR